MLPAWGGKLAFLVTNAAHVFARAGGIFKLLALKMNLSSKAKSMFSFLVEKSTKERRNF